MLWPFVGGAEGEGEGCMLKWRTRECGSQRETRNCGQRRIGGQKRSEVGKVIGVERRAKRSHIYLSKLYASKVKNNL
jgi:hypothetical protein